MQSYVDSDFPSISKIQRFAHRDIPQRGGMNAVKRFNFRFYGVLRV